MASLRRGLARVPAWVVDAGWAVAVAVAVTIAIRVAREPGVRALDLLAYALVPHKATLAGPATLLTSTHAPGLRGRMLWLRWKMLSGS